MPIKKEENQSTPKGIASEYKRRILMIAGVMLTVIGVAGVILPVLPGVPLLILAAACFARSSPKLEQRLLTHPTLGPGIIAWRERGVIPIRAKIPATLMMAVSALVIAQSSAPPLIKGLVFISIGGAALFVLSRPNK